VLTLAEVGAACALLGFIVGARVSATVIQRQIEAAVGPTVAALIAQRVNAHLSPSRKQTTDA
jgi:alpha/beta superfamily hydrolase